MGVETTPRLSDITTPKANKPAMRADPPEETNGSGTPKTGSNSNTTAMLTSA
jgi:hypothetical protein